MNFLKTVVHHRKTTGNYQSSESFSMETEQSHMQVETQSRNFHRTSIFFQASKSVSLPQPIPIFLRKTSHNTKQPEHEVRQTTSVPLLSPPAVRSLVLPQNQYLCSPAATPSPRPSSVESIPSTSRFRIISSNLEDTDTSISPEVSPEDDEELVETLNRPSSNNRDNNKITHGIKRKSIRNDDVNAALIGALSSLTQTKRVLQETPRADQLFADSVAAELQRFPPRKKNLLKSEIMRLISGFDDIELEQ